MRYSLERREAILAKLEAPYKRTINDVAELNGLFMQRVLARETRL